LRRLGTRVARIGSIVAAVLALAGCVAIPSAACAPGESAAVAEWLYFGGNMPGSAIVTPAAWSDFIDHEVAPRFPQGFTTWQAAGQWRGANGAIQREASHVVALVHADTSANARAVAAIADRYKQLFRQEAVLRVRVPACMSL
jgi:uncharacterized protein DUF3574